MAKDNVLFGYALLDDAQCTVSIDDIDRDFARQHKFFCPHCHKEMYATFGEVQSPHFRHNGDKCQHSKYLHDLAEHIFFEEYLKCLDKGLPFFLDLHIPLPCNNACVLKRHSDCKEHYIRKTVDLTKEYTLISLETRVDVDEGYRRPDILLESLDDNQLWIEIWVSHETELEKRKDGRIIEIKIETEEDLEMIRQHKIIQSEGSDLAVRIFGIEPGDDSILSVSNKINPITGLPCDNYYRYEVTSSDHKAGVVDKIKTDVSDGLSYLIILRLNWYGQHDSTGGVAGEKISEDDLRFFCLQRFCSQGYDGPLYKGVAIDSLVVYEWRDTSSRPSPIHSYTPYPRSTHKPHYRQSQPQTTVSTDLTEMEWVDLGLPSGILWAKDDVDNKGMTFMNAQSSYGAHVPSWDDAYELKEFCTREWDDRIHALVFTGPNGNTLSFPCKEDNKSYWLNAYEKGDIGFGQCFHIGPDNHFWINDKDVNSVINVRLVSR